MPAHPTPRAGTRPLHPPRPLRPPPAPSRAWQTGRRLLVRTGWPLAGRSACSCPPRRRAASAALLISLSVSVCPSSCVSVEDVANLTASDVMNRVNLGYLQGNCAPVAGGWPRGWPTPRRRSAWQPPAHTRQIGRTSQERGSPRQGLSAPRRPPWLPASAWDLPPGAPSCLPGRLSRRRKPALGTQSACSQPLGAHPALGKHPDGRPQAAVPAPLPAGAG